MEPYYPIVIISQRSELKELWEYCQETRGRGDIECKFEGVKVINEHIYVCIRTFSMGLTFLELAFPTLIITDENTLITGTPSPDYPRKIPYAIPNWKSIQLKRPSH